MELEKGDLDSQPLHTFIRVRKQDSEWRYLLHVSATGDFGRCWMADDGTRWRFKDVPADFIELLWHPEGWHSAGLHPEELAEVRVLRQVANGSDRPRLAPPGDFEPENYATDGSVGRELAELRGALALAERQHEQDRALLLAARTSVENMSGMQEVRRDGALAKELRELRMILLGGDAIRKTARAEEKVEEWLQDPQRSVFDLTAALLTILGPTGGAWK